jgi:CoA:oxalate CoA-transferase
MVYPLAGLRVLDMSRVVSGPFAARLMADLGADVVKLEAPTGDLSQVWGQERHGLSGFYTQQNAGKRNVAVDLRVAGGSDLVRRLTAVADVVIENFRPGVMARYGLGWDTLSALNPRLIMLSVTGFGQRGPRSGRQAFAPVIHAESGILARQANFDQVWPTDPTLSVADYNAALHGLIAVLAALHLRDRTGQGQHIDLAMLATMLATDEYVHHALDESPVERLGGEVWEAVGGPILIAGTLKNTWYQLSGAFALKDPSPPGSTLDTKIDNRRRVITEWLTAFVDRGVLIAALESADLPWAEIRTTAEALADAEADGWPMVAQVDDHGGGRRRVLQSPYRFSDADAGVQGPAPRLGQHNREVVAEWLGTDAAAIATMEDDGILVRRG